MNVIAGFTLIKVGLWRLFSANLGFPFQLAATMGARTRIDITRLHGVLHFQEDARANSLVQIRWAGQFPLGRRWVPTFSLSALGYKQTLGVRNECPLRAKSGHSNLLGLRTRRQAAEWVLVLFWLDFHTLPEGKANEDKKNGDDCHADPLCCCHGRPLAVKRLL
jgi:hypothetical protein